MPAPSIIHLADLDQTVIGDLFIDASGNIFGDSETSGGAYHVFGVAAGPGTVSFSAAFDYDTLGGAPTGGLAADANGTLYGTAFYGQGTGYGGLYAANPGTLALIARTGGSPALPEGPPVIDASGNIVFTTSGSEVLEVTAGTAVYHVLATGSDIGPRLTVDAAGDIFGTTGDGAHGYGSVFEIQAGTNTLTTLVDFDSANGSVPEGALVVDAAGNVYGNAHNLFEIQAGTHTYSVLATFSDGGIDETNQIAVDGTGTIFGTTAANSVYELKAGSGTISTLLAEAQGIGGLVVGQDGNLYGATSNGAIDEVTPCYCRGTLILTAEGECPVEDLSIGDTLVTAAGPVRPLRWIGRRSFDGRFAAGNVAILPVVIHAHALADDVPRRDLWVSPDHALFIDGVLIPAKALVNGQSVVQVQTVSRVDYFHLELDTHDIILAEGAPAETFLEDGNRGQFHNGASYPALYPHAPTVTAALCAPWVEDGQVVEAVRHRLASRARHGAAAAA